MAGYKSNVVQIGNLSIGGEYPVRIQSMTNTNTLNTESTVNQVVRLAEAGCELVRITAQGTKEAENLREIKKLLYQKNIKLPLIADIHYNPKAAELAATIVDKVRINPGNYITAHRKSISGKYSNGNYYKELEEIKSNLLPLINICKSHGTAIRIGVNHGSLGDRIVDRYGDTVQGMVISAVEYARICNELNFNNLVLSVKSSNPVMMAEAYRLLAFQLTKEGLYYPLHLGVTEAGNGVEGRTKSYVGIGSVLSYGIGDTIRVSLTEDPVNEIPVALELVKRFSVTPHPDNARAIRSDLSLEGLDLLEFPGKVSAKFPFNEQFFPLLLEKGDTYWVCEEKDVIRQIDQSGLIPVLNTLAADKIFNSEIPGSKSILIKMGATDTVRFIETLRGRGIMNPVILMSPSRPASIIELLIENSIHPGSLLLNGLAQGLCLPSISEDITEIIEAGFNILQATRARITKTEYISCPSCGRTQFNIEQRLEEVKRATSHLTGLKIAVMGCIVNGPGEMADADFGYVGAGNGKVTLYRKKEIVIQSLPEEDAINELLRIIETNKKDEL